MRGDKPITSLGEHSVLVRTKLSDAAIAILEEELGGKEFERQAWVELTVRVEKMSAKREIGWEEDVGGEEREGGGEEKGGDMSIRDKL